MRGYLQLALLMAVLAGMVAGPALRTNRSYAVGKANEDEAWSTKQVMDKVYSGKQALMSVVYRDMQKAEPDWNADAKNLAEAIRLMSMLSKQKPPRGSQEAWEKLVEDYLQKAKVAQQHIREHKLWPARASLEKLGSTCDECHDNHGIP